MRMAWLSFSIGFASGCIVAWLLIKVSVWEKAWLVKWRSAEPSPRSRPEATCPVLLLEDQDLDLLPYGQESHNSLPDRGCLVLNRCCCACMESQALSGSVPVT